MNADGQDGVEKSTFPHNPITFWESALILQNGGNGPKFVKINSMPEAEDIFLFTMVDPS